MKAIINGISVEGTPQEILEYQRLQGMKDKLPLPKPRIDVNRLDYDNNRLVIAESYR